MSKQPIEYMPFVVALTCGAALVIVGAALKPDVSNDWLAFSGSLLGSGIAALVGYWLLVTQERRIDKQKQGKIAEALLLIRESTNTLIEAGKGNNLPRQAEDAVENLRTNADATAVVIQYFGVTNIATLVAIRALQDVFDNLTWSRILTTARHADTLKILYPNDVVRDDHSMFQDIGDMILSAVSRVERTLN